MANPAFVELNGVAKRWNGELGVEDITLSIEEGAFVALLGPSGCPESCRAASANALPWRARSLPGRSSV